MLVGPKAEVQAVASMLGANLMGHLWVIDCDASSLHLSFVLGGKDFELEGDDLILERQGNLCLLGLQSSEGFSPSRIPFGFERLNRFDPRRRDVERFLGHHGALRRGEESSQRSYSEDLPTSIIQQALRVEREAFPRRSSCIAVPRAPGARPCCMAFPSKTTGPPWENGKTRPASSNIMAICMCKHEHRVSPANPGKCRSEELSLEEYAVYARDNQVDWPFYVWERNFTGDRHGLLEDFATPKVMGEDLYDLSPEANELSSFTFQCPDEVVQRLARLYGDERHSDDTAPQRFVAHRSIIAMWSEPLGSMLCGPFAEGSAKEVKLLDVEPAAFEVLLKLIYTGVVDISPETVLSILDVAVRFDVAALMQFSVQFLQNHATSEHACRMLEVGHCELRLPADPGVLIHPQMLSPGEFTSPAFGCHAGRSARRLAGGVVKKTVFPIEVLAGGNRQGADLRQLWQPYGVARDTSTGETYVADMMNHRVQRWTDGGSPETVFGGTFGGGLDQLKYPRGLALLSGSLYIADSGNHRVLRWDVSGGSSAVVVAGEWGVLYDRQNQVRANDASCCRGGSGVNQLRDPHGVFVDGSGDIYVAEQRISGVK
eukprot:g21343.t1